MLLYSCSARSLTAPDTYDSMRHLFVALFCPTFDAMRAFFFVMPASLSIAALYP
jgi:hypothetical protein